jgi:hypothetical protein
MATALTKRDERIRSQYANIVTVQDIDLAKPDETGTTQFIRDRLGKTWDIYHKFFYGTHHVDSPVGAKYTEAAQADLLSGLSTVLPLSTRNSIERRGLLDNAAVGREKVGSGTKLREPQQAIVGSKSRSAGRTTSWQPRALMQRVTSWT